jgi:hypothetical protein
MKDNNMHNLLILYNPYYNQEMLEDHVRILGAYEDMTQARVGLGKIRSKMRDYEHSRGERIDALYGAISPQSPLQLYLTDFSSMYVCYVEEVADVLPEGVDAPEYYAQLDVEKWFVVSDIREIARNDFEYVRDQVLVGLTTPNYGNHTYALYGNRYDYPLEVEQKEPLHYFESFHTGKRHFGKVFKSSTYAALQQDLIHYVYGREILYAMHPDSMESIIHAEMVYAEHRENATYDFASVVVQYAKAFENELYYFLRRLFEKLMGYDSALESIGYQVQGREFVLYDYLSQKPNMGTNKYLLGNNSIYKAYTAYYDYKTHATLLNLLKYDIKHAINTIQSIRNEASHGGSISKAECQEVRAVMLGIGRESIMSTMMKARETL